MDPYLNKWTIAYMSLGEHTEKETPPRSRKVQYLSWEVMVGLLWEEWEVWWQVRHDIMGMSNSNCLRQVCLEIRCKCSIANTRLPKCHDFYAIQSIVHLKEHRYLFLGVEAKQAGRKLWEISLFFLGNIALPTFLFKAIFMVKIITAQTCGRWLSGTQHKL